MNIYVYNCPYLRKRRQECNLFCVFIHTCPTARWLQYIHAVCIARPPLCKYSRVALSVQHAKGWSSDVWSCRRILSWGRQTGFCSKEIFAVNFNCEKVLYDSSHPHDTLVDFQLCNIVPSEVDNPHTCTNREIAGNTIQFQEGQQNILDDRALKQFPKLNDNDNSTCKECFTNMHCLNGIRTVHASVVLCGGPNPKQVPSADWGINTSGTPGGVHN